MLLQNFANELQRFLGMITNLWEFIPNLVEVTSPRRTLLKKEVKFKVACPSRTLLKKEVKFKLEKPQLDAIGKFKLLVTTTPCLKVFNTNLLIRLRTDANSKELIFLLERNHVALTYSKWYPFRYASRLLRDYEKRYAQIEKEALFIVFVVERLHE